MLTVHLVCAYPGAAETQGEEGGMKMILEWQGTVYAIESCETCPARDGVWCRIRKSRLRKLRSGRLFPSSQCPAHPEGQTFRSPGRLAPMKPTPKKRTKKRDRIHCRWCGQVVNPYNAVYVVGDKRQGHIYCRFECLEQDLRTLDK